METVTCHELVHAFTQHLKLPTWLHEGLATLAMELYLDWRIVRKETLELLDGASQASRGREELRVSDPEAIVAAYARAYWSARYLRETRPDVVKELLLKPRGGVEIEALVAAAYGEQRKDVWDGIHERLLDHFG